VRPNEPLAPRTTLRVGGPAELLIEPASEADLAAIVQVCSEHSSPWFVLGRGSNLLVRDGGVRGVVICLSQPFFSRLEGTGERLECGAGARLKAVAVEARRRGLSGLEFLEGIPGGVGGALRMNAGAMGSSIFDVVEEVRAMDAAGHVRCHAASELGAAYRSCVYFKDHLALSAVLRGEPAPEAEIRQRMDTFSRKRWLTQPPQPSAGCIFKNPAGIPAGKLIEELGLKGKQLGGAMVSPVHGNFLVNTGGATACDLLALIALIQERALAERGIQLETEVQIIGEEAG